MKLILMSLLLMAELLEGQTQQANRGAAIDRLIEEQNKPRIIIKCDGLGWALVITAHGWGGIHHGSSIAVNYPTGLDCDKIITDLGLVLDEGKPEPETGKPPVAYIKLVTGDKMENFKTFNREVVARCFIDVADAVYADRGGAEAFFAKYGRPSCIKDADFQNRKKPVAPPPSGSLPPARNGLEGRPDQRSNVLEQARDTRRDAERVAEHKKRSPSNADPSSAAARP